MIMVVHDMAIDTRRILWACALAGILVLGACSRSSSGSSTPPTPPPIPGLAFLDLSFQGQGFVLEGSTLGGGADTGFAVVEDAQGRLVVAGGSLDQTGFTQMTVWRYLNDGSRDLTFNGQGFVTFSDPGESVAGRDVLIDPQGRIVVVGGGLDAGTWIWRYLPDGTPDASFGGAGFVQTFVGRSQGFAGVIDGLSRIVVVGRNDGDLLLWRYLADGTPDPLFGAVGVVQFSLGVASVETAGTILLDSQGRILVAGSIQDTHPFDLFMTVWRFLSDGSLDPAFGAGAGYVRETVRSAAGGLAIDSQERLVVTGHLSALPWFVASATWRFLSDGTLDTTFNQQGFVAEPSRIGTGPEFSSSGHDVMVAPTGEITVVGYRTDNTAWDLCLWQYLDDGSRDTTFGDVGIKQLTVSPGVADPAGARTSDQGYRALVDGLGRTVVVGDSRDPNFSFSVSRSVVWRLR